MTDVRNSDLILQQAVARYADFLPMAARPHAGPDSTWWHWRGQAVHVARARRPHASARVLVVHGGGGWSGALWPLAACLVGELGDVAAPDLPSYGLTRVADVGAVRYEDWVDLLMDFVRAEEDGRPLVIIGASMGGMLGYEVAARTGAAAALLATCLLDPAAPSARRAAARFSILGGPAPYLLSGAARVAGRLRLPIRWLADVGAMSSAPGLSRLCAEDPRGGGARVPLGFLASWFSFQHSHPESFVTTPVHLLHPADDAWTPPSLSTTFLRRIAAPTTSTMLEGCGHFPVEPPGLFTMREAVHDVLRA